MDYVVFWLRKGNFGVCRRSLAGRREKVVDVRFGPGTTYDGL